MQKLIVGDCINQTNLIASGERTCVISRSKATKNTIYNVNTILKMATAVRSHIMVMAAIRLIGMVVGKPFGSDKTTNVVGVGYIKEMSR